MTPIAKFYFYNIMLKLYLKIILNLKKTHGTVSDAIWNACCPCCTKLNTVMGTAAEEPTHYPMPTLDVSQFLKGCCIIPYKNGNSNMSYKSSFTTQ